MVGETGSGKSTQVPQYILEDAAARGVVANVLVTQPRRIAAIGVADRIAAERGETVGEVVGYAIRGEARACERTALLFNTTGVCLRRLQEDGLAGVTHVVVDEVHERTLEADFLLLALRELVRLRNARGEPPLKILLMSATMPGEAVRGYFGRGCVTVKFPGRADPASSRGASATGRRRCSALEGAGEACLNVDLVCELVDWFAVRCGGDVDAAVADARASLGDASRDAPAPGGGGLAVLVFVVGVKEIEACSRRCARPAASTRGGSCRSTARCRPTSSAASSSPPPGTTKVVVAANVAERRSAIPASRSSSTRAASGGALRRDAPHGVARRRLRVRGVGEAAPGRGSVAAGLAVHLFQRCAPLEAHAEPGCAAWPSSSSCCGSRPYRRASCPGGRRRRPARRCRSRPSQRRSRGVGLVAIGALTAREAADDDEQLTELGALLARLPVDARLGKLVVLAACRRVPRRRVGDRGALGNRSPFLSPMERREEADASKRGFVPRHANTQDGCEASDLLCVRQRTRRSTSLGRGSSTSRDRFLSIKTLQAIGALKRQLLEALHFAGLVVATAPVPPLAPFLLSGNKLELDNGTLLLDGWLKCGTEPRNAADLALHLREKIDARVSGLLKGDLASRTTATCATASRPCAP
ncbi:helicase [Aureococcus anophagefferens]|nr:helicase [Aureococcus anophagefferens]